MKLSTAEFINEWNSTHTGSPNWQDCINWTQDSDKEYLRIQILELLRKIKEESIPDSIRHESNESPEHYQLRVALRSGFVEGFECALKILSDQLDKLLGRISE